MQAGPEVSQQARDRDPRNRPVALETPKDQYNRHLEAARSRSGSLGPRLASPRHASPVNGEAPAKWFVTLLLLMSWPLTLKPQGCPLASLPAFTIFDTSDMPS